MSDQRPKGKAIRGHRLRRVDGDPPSRGMASRKRITYRCECGRSSYDTSDARAAAAAHGRHLDDLWAQGKR